MSDEELQVRALDILQAGTIIKITDEYVAAAVEDFETGLITVRKYDRAEYEADYPSVCIEPGRSFIMLTSGHHMWSMDIWDDHAQRIAHDTAKYLADRYLPDED